MACPAGSRCRCGSWRSGGSAGSPGSTPGCASVTTIRRTASSPRHIAPHQRVEHGERAVTHAAGEARPFGPQEVALMAAAPSPATGEAYGVKRVCTIWGVARSSFYDARRQKVQPLERPAGRRGPKPALTDVELLAAIRRDLARSPWTGEGHRKVWARLRVIDGIRVSRTRVLRIMGENRPASIRRACASCAGAVGALRWPAG